MPSFGREVNPSIPCRRFAACKRSLHLPWKSHVVGKIGSAISSPYFLSSLIEVSHVVGRGAPLEMTGESKSGAQRAPFVRPRCIGAAGPRIRPPLYSSLTPSWLIKPLVVFRLLFHFILWYLQNTTGMSHRKLFSSVHILQGGTVQAILLSLPGKQKKTGLKIFRKLKQELIKYINLQSDTTSLHTIHSIRRTQQLHVSAFVKPSSGCNLKWS